MDPVHAVVWVSPNVPISEFAMTVKERKAIRVLDKSVPRVKNPGPEDQVFDFITKTLLD